MHTLLLTCAGNSARFPNYRPKWALTHPSGNMMAVEAIRGLHGYDRVVVVMRASHLAEYGTANVQREFALAGYPDVSVVSVPPTDSQVATVMAALGCVSGAFTIKDCDNAFDLRVPQGNAVAVVDLHDVAHVNAANKSYARVQSDTSRVVGLREKEIVSHLFCCGAYTFSDPGVFLAGATSQTKFISQVVDRLVHDGLEFRAVPVGSYVDWGTEEDWHAYVRTFKTMFVDIDGVLCEASHRSFAPVWGETVAIQSNIDYLNALSADGRVDIILTTSRDEAARGVTAAQLSRLGVRYSRLIMGLRNCQRVLVNDIVSSRGEATALAVQIERDSPTLAQEMRRIR